MTETREPSFVPIERAALRALVPAVDGVDMAAEEQRAALARLFELADDLCADAVQRLRERGASAAQVERYEAAYLDQSAAVRAAGTGLATAISELNRLAHELAEV